MRRHRRVFGLDNGKWGWDGMGWEGSEEEAALVLKPVEPLFLEARLQQHTYCDTVSASN